MLVNTEVMGVGDNGNIMEARGSHCPQKKRQTNQ